ncbi:MocR-like pyridoxine biosynthesis transcription factor PdxR [Pseudomonas sp. S11A4]|uniref:MocR-like pyridoxine biosynthesis transcription factor PdxR n=1 Tax=Pseudomonas sp. S11A4 TaxID=1476791 RepID=UPI00215B99B8|nr:PLP-dependent aminotransferase family protein [Pseudomonas sp. S11A4]MCR8932241.1 PLP-dependent aminotransferase family protein [Pseudomonas sp. S11A4]
MTDLLLKSLDKQSSHPMQKQIYDIVRFAVLDHTLISGQKLPSSRALASDLKISRITISLAYDRLIAENYLITRAGNGTYVAPTLKQPLGAAPQSIHTQHSMQLSGRGSQLSFLPGGMGHTTGAFVPGVADSQAFPFHIWKRLIARHLSKGNLALSGYANHGGLSQLREAIAGYLKISRSVNCEPAQIIITSGTHQSVDLCARLLADVGDTAIVENPCHWAFPTVFAASGLEVAGGNVNDYGLDLENSYVPPRTKIVVVTPSHHYPTGVVMPLSRRLELLQSARAHNLWVIEDDYDSEFRYDGAPLPSLQGLDNDGRVIYIGTFSKAMFAGVRMGFLVVPSHLSKAFSRASTKLFRPGALHLQAALADFIYEGHFSQHIRKMRGEYSSRQDLLRFSLEKSLGDIVRLSSARAGLHVFAQFSADVNYQSVINESKREGIFLGTPCFVKNIPALENRCFVLGFGGVPLEKIETGVQSLTTAVSRSIDGERSSSSDPSDLGR